MSNETLTNQREIFDIRGTEVQVRKPCPGGSGWGGHRALDVIRHGHRRRPKRRAGRGRDSGLAGPVPIQRSCVEVAGQEESSRRSGSHGRRPASPSTGTLRTWSRDR